MPELDLSRLLGDSLGVLRKHFVAVGLVLVVVTALTQATSGPFEIEPGEFDPASPRDLLLLLPLFAVLGFVALAVMLLIFLVRLLFDLAAVRAASEAYDGGTPQLGAVLGVASSRLPRAILPSLLALLFIVLGFIALVVPGIIVAVGLFPLTAVLLNEDHAPMAAIKRTWALTKGHKPILFAAVIVLVVGGAILGGIVGLIPIVGDALGGAVSGFFAAWQAAAAAHFYRWRLAADQPPAPPAPPVTDAAPPTW